MIATPHIKTEVENHHIGFRTAGTLPEAYSLGWLTTRHPCKTGCWSFNSTTGKHEINLSPLAYNTIVDGTVNKGKRIQVPALFRNVYEHEAAHSLWSDKDLKSFSALLASEGIPWRLCNLFEDCRIERRWFTGPRKYRAFGWTKWMPQPEPADFGKISATKLLYCLKNDGGSKRRSISMDCYRHFMSLPFFRKVYDFHYRIIHCREMKDLLPILREWLKEFPASGDDTIEEEGGLGTGDLKDSISASGGSTKDVKAKDKAGNGAAPEKRSGAEGEKPEESNPEGKGYGVVHGESGTPEAGVADHSNPREREEAKYGISLAGMLTNAFKSPGLLKAPRSAPSKRLNVRGLLRGDWSRPFIGAKHGAKGKPHVSLLVDCSGSTAGASAYVDRERRLAPIKVDAGGRILVRALSTLARRGKITATVYATACGGLHRKIELPIKSPFEISELRGFSSSEGIGDVLQPCHAVFKEISSRGKLVVCYTDGCITDTPVNQAALKERGLYTLGVCCSTHDTSAEMKKHFEGSMIRESLWGLADALVRQLRTITQ
jgi:hypothetical protein